MDTEQDHYQEGKRAGVHPIIVIFGAIVGLWLFIWLIVPNPKHRQGTAPESVPAALPEDPDAAAVMFKVHATIREMNAISVVVPPQATDSQVIGLLKRFRDARLSNTLPTWLPPTTPKHKLGEHAVADIFIFSDSRFAVIDVVRELARGAHAPGEFYPQAVPFETAMEQVRGHYRIDLNDTGTPDHGSLGFADESGVHSKQYRRVF
ncbi:MAG: hypothetical protein ACREII_00360 [Nitrospiraceae bacterium]